MKMRALVPAVATASLLLSACAADPVAPEATDRPSLITYGTVAGDLYPAVVLIRVDLADGTGWRCSGTLISPTLVLTAGHCVFPDPESNPIVAVRVFTESNVQTGNNSYPKAGLNSVEATYWEAHPLYTTNTWWMHDVGVVVLSQPVILPAGSYGVLPTLNQLDALRPRSSTTFTAVGYGYQRINPVHVEAQRVRMISQPHLIQINNPAITGRFSILLSNNAATGGTCFGDSGGPNFIGTSMVIAGVTSYGRNGNCVGTGGVFRVDRQDVLDFIGKFLTAY